MLSINIADVIAVLQTMIPQLVIIIAALVAAIVIAIVVTVKVKQKPKKKDYPEDDLDCIFCISCHHDEYDRFRARLLHGEHGHGRRKDLR